MDESKNPAQLKGISNRKYREVDLSRRTGSWQCVGRRLNSMWHPKKVVAAAELFQRKSIGTWATTGRIMDLSQSRRRKLVGIGCKRATRTSYTSALAEEGPTKETINDVH